MRRSSISFPKYYHLFINQELTWPTANNLVQYFRLQFVVVVDTTANAWLRTCRHWRSFQQLKWPSKITQGHQQRQIIHDMLVIVSLYPIQPPKYRHISVESCTFFTLHLPHRYWGKNIWSGKPRMMCLLDGEKVLRHLFPHSARIWQTQPSIVSRGTKSSVRFTSSTYRRYRRQRLAHSNWTYGVCPARQFPPDNEIYMPASFQRPRRFPLQCNKSNHFIGHYYVVFNSVSLQQNVIFLSYIMHNIIHFRNATVSALDDTIIATIHNVIMRVCTCAHSAISAEFQTPWKLVKMNLIVEYWLTKKIV